MNNPRYYPHERNRYFYGKLLTVRDFESEQKYFNDKRRMNNRLMHGAGVLCGLQVVAVDDKTISVETGMALDYAGREIIVSAPVTQKLSMIDGFNSNDYAKNIYLCIAYDERGKEPVYSVASSATRPDEVGEHNRIQEGYRLFIREDAPDPASFGFSRLFESVSLLYNDEQLRIWQKCPRYVNADETFDITLVVEKSLQVPRIKIEYEIGGNYLSGVDKKTGNIISFQEPEKDQDCTYQIKFPFRAASATGMADNVHIRQGRLKIEMGNKVIDPECDCSQVLQILEEPVKERILHEYQNMNLDQYLDKDDPAIYLARISLTQIGPSFMIEKVEPVPFAEYAFNFSDLFKLGVLGAGGGSQGPYQTRSNAYLLDAGEKPRLDVRYLPDNNLFDFELGIPEAHFVAAEIRTGIALIETEANPKAGKSYFSDEIEHGLGSGPVFIVTGVEESSDEELMKTPQHSEQIFFGSYEVFQKSSYESLAPRVAIGTVVYPQRGSFRIGVRCQTATVTQIKIRWWAYKPT